MAGTVRSKGLSDARKKDKRSAKDAEAERRAKLKAARKAKEKAKDDPKQSKDDAKPSSQVAQESGSPGNGADVTSKYNEEVAQFRDRDALAQDDES